jgi:rubrerythrin
METASKKQTILELLAENEVAVARLYRAYAEKFPRRKDFWNTLVREEIQHSRWIQKLSTGTHAPVQIKEDRFDVAVFQISFDYLEDKLAQAKSEDLSHKEALATALDIETGMFERGYFEVFEGDDPELRKVLNLLAKETKKHTDSIRNALARKRWKLF